MPTTNNTNTSLTNGPGQQADIKQAKRLDRAVRFARFTVLCLRIIYAVARHLPTAFIAAVLTATLLAVVAPLLVPLGLVVVLFAAVAVQVRYDGHRARLDAAAALVLAALFTWRWAAQMQRSELDRLVHGRNRVARLRSAKVQAITWRYSIVPQIQRLDIEVQPLDIQKPDEWPEMARRIQVRHQFAAHSYRPESESRFRAAYANQLLPGKAIFNPVTWGTWTEANPAVVNLGHTGNIDAPDPWITWELDVFPHMMINGKTGGGKSTPQRAIQAHGLVHGAEQIVLSGKRSGEFGWGRRLGVMSVVSTPPGWAEAVGYLRAEFERRQRLLEESGFEHWWQHPDIGHRIFCYVDELMLVTGAVVKDELSPFRTATAGALTELAAAARSCGIHLVMVTQYGIAQSAGNTGSLMRFNLSARMVVGHSNGDGLKAAFDEPVPEQLANHVKGTIQGRCLYGQFNRHHGAFVTPGQVWNITQDHATTFAPSEPAHLPVDFDALGEATIAALTNTDTPASNGRNRRNR